MASSRRSSRVLFAMSFMFAVLISGSSCYSYGSQSPEEDQGSFSPDENTQSQLDYLSGLLAEAGFNPAESLAEEQAEEQYQQPEEQHEQPEEQYQQPEEQHQQSEEQNEQPEEQHEQPEEQNEQPGEQPVEQYEQPEEQHEQPEEQHEQPEEQYEQPEEQNEQPEEQYEQPEEEQNEQAEEEQNEQAEDEEIEQPEEEKYEQPEEEEYEQPEEQEEEQEQEEPEHEEEENSYEPDDEESTDNSSDDSDDSEAFDDEVPVKSVPKTTPTGVTPVTKPKTTPTTPKTCAGHTCKPTGVPPVTTPKPCTTGVPPVTKPTTSKPCTGSHCKSTGVPPVTKPTTSKPCTGSYCKSTGVPHVTKPTTSKPCTGSHCKSTGVPPVTKPTTSKPCTGSHCKSTGVPPVTRPTTHKPCTGTKCPPVTPKPDLGLCNACVIIHGVGYAPFPGQCGYYIQCRFVGDKPTTVNIRKCPHGLQWNQKKLTCDYSHIVKCKSVDLCPTQKAIPGDRSAYLVAFLRGWIRVACPPKKAYNAATCKCTDDLDGHKNYETCDDKRPIPGDKRKYLVLSPSGWVVMPCPSTLGYDENTCRCTIKLHEIDDKSHECKPTLKLTFDNNDATDSSPNKFWVNNTGATFKDGKAYFNGNAKLTIPGLSNMELGNQVYILIKFKQISVSKPQTLVANGDCAVRPSISICSGAHALDFYSETNAQLAPAEVTVAKDVGQWQRAMYVLDSNHLQGYVGNHYKSKPVGGSIETRQRGLVIGGGGNCENFHGIIDMIVLYRCKPQF